MSDSGDEFSDGIVLDDQMLAALDEEESRFQRATHPNAGDPERPAKRRKLDTGHPPNLGVFSHSTPDDIEDLPDITVRRDGTYGIELHGPITPVANAALGGNTRSPTTYVSRPAVAPSNNPLGYTTHAGGNFITHAPLARPGQSRRLSATTHPPRVSSARVEVQPILRSQSDSIPHNVDPSYTDFFDTQLADMRRLTNEV
ncbi:hypothetical protein K503DRAFT_375692 [Rhizopogon vinicolor AM-OR11-026]|uniref:Uncharacterized protein n=1 Tax=Rhizopogon vinicolor AM-OR11-026 TaxID=1314800 RepID=A0A1B7NBV0_9AGAM|nr:hypothetical protein K503DRAFT_375692 [Rhizopogon vinicolor AM-OR11-026]